MGGTSCIHACCIFYSIQFYDEMSQQESSVDGETEDPPQPVSMVTKVLQLSGLSVELDYSHLTNINFREEQDFFRGRRRMAIFLYFCIGINSHRKKYIYTCIYKHLSN